MLLVVIIFAISFIRSFFPPEKTRKVLSHKKDFIGNILAAFLGIVTPFCSCSAVPLFTGFIEGGVPLGVTFSFLISSPMVNEVAIVLLWALFGWQVTAVYIGTGLFVAIIAGYIIGKLKLEQWAEEYVYNMHVGENQQIRTQTFRERIGYARCNTKDILGTVLAFMMAVTALSLPEMIILRKVLKVKLLVVFMGIMAVTIVAVGYLFNAIM
ncbi:MAG: putative permease [Syntrophorhabdaceae bacterium PtaU1.Bin034]|nr:MAG: putative permease [Syntrophorhabdaceae bacterium PtaU1.Bin034]